LRKREVIEHQTEANLSRKPMVAVEEELSTFLFSINSPFN
jgi:hypothetical protein